MRAAARTCALGLAVTALSSLVGACGETHVVDDARFCRETPHGAGCPSTDMIGSGGAAGAQGSGGANTGLPVVCDKAEIPDTAMGTFVAPDGSDALGNGSQTRPYASITRALGGPVTPSRVYVRQGTYPLAKTLQLASGPLGVTIDGGWTATWERACDAPEATVLSATFADAPAVRVDGGVTLARLTVATPANAPPALPGHAGASLLALLVHSGQLTLSDARLVAGDASDGGAAVTVEDAMAAAACDGLTDCDSAAGAAGEPGAAGAFGVTAEGFVPGNGADGTPGANGKNGTAGAAASMSSLCVKCSGMPSAPSERTDAYCAAQNYDVVKRTGAPGACGCGGKGGAGGKGGKGGGASVALLVVSGAKVAVEGTRALLRSGHGGAGTPGAPGAKGARGAQGRAGDIVMCQDLGSKQAGQCMYSAGADACLFEGPVTNLSGEAGGPGGAGEPGGPGGPGSGGPSYGAVSIDSATIVVNEAAIVVGEGGVGGDGQTRAESSSQKRF